MCHAFLAPPAANTDRIFILLFWATVAVECFTPTPIIPLISLIKQLPFQRIVQTAVCLMDGRKDQQKKIDVLEAMHYTVSAWW
jgi:hypothetical protein